MKRNYQAIMAVDPGTTTGVVTGIIPIGIGSIASLLADAHIESDIIQGPTHEQGKELFDRWLAFRDLAIKKHKVAPTDIELAFEDFILTKFTTSERHGIDPVRVTTAFLSYRLGWYEGMGQEAPELDIRWQQPSEMSYATNDRLRDWGLWVVGSSSLKEHERDARRHLAICLTKYGRRKSGVKRVKG